MGHYSKFGFALWDTTANLVLLFGTLQQIWSHAMGHCSGFGYALCGMKLHNKNL
jgi:hypothetical protein